MDVDTAAETGVGVIQQQQPDSPVDTLSGVESKKHRMQTGQDSDDFSSRYQLLEQLGSGASGTVWKCRLAPGQGAGGVGAGDEPVPGKTYAAKIIDLRPFKLRERFSMQRLMREVDIMQRLRHPNIIRLVEALDTPEQLVLILEYAPGVELFDAILSKASFSEDEARPVFVQVARALQYMHSKHIVHRDVKPENVMIIDRASEDGLRPEAKLLDFGLSKAIDADMGGSVARTFVGTPSYLAPEVEEKKGGKGKPYGTPVDCWSLGAMLYVMLVARFPEFQVQGVRKNVRMHGPLWDKVSSEAKELIQNLMAFDAGARLTVDKALRHPWLGELAAKDPPPSPLQEATVPTGMQGIPPLPENFAFTVPPEVMRAGAATGGSFSSPGGQRFQERSGSSGEAWCGRPPVVTEQETPPATTKKKAFGLTPTGPTIRELDPDESPLPSLDLGMRQKMPDNQHRNNSSSSSSSSDSNNNDSNNKDSNNKDSEASNTTTTNNNNNSGNTNDNGKRSDSVQTEERSSGETAMVSLRGLQIGLAGPPPDGSVPLLQLQERITAVMETAVETYSVCPEGTSSLRRSAALCRESLRESVTLLRKIEHTAAQVITLFPDLTLAVEEGEPELAHDFFSTVKTWVREMYTAVNVVQARNSANALEVGESMKKHAEMGREGQRLVDEELQRQNQQQQRRSSAGVAGGTAYVAMGGVQGTQAPNGGGVEAGGARDQGDNEIALDPETFEVVRQIQELRKSLSSNTASTASGGSAASDTPADLGTTASATAVDDTAAAAAGATTVGSSTQNDEKLINLFLRMAGRGPSWPPVRAGGNSGNGGGSEGSAGAAQAEESKGSRQQGHGAVNVDAVVDGLASQMSIDDGMDAPRADAPGTDRVEMVPPPPQAEEQRFGAGTDAGGGEGGGGGGESGAWGGGAELARLQKDKIYAEVQRSLQMLHEVDNVLEHLALFWANSEVIFDVLLKKSDLVEKFVAFANKPRLLQRFRERLAEYERFWEGVQTVCCMYVCGQRKCGGIGAPPTCPGTPCGGSMGEETTYDRSFNASSHRTHSNSSAGSHGPGETGGMPPMGGLGGAGGWANMEMGMDGVP